MTGFGGADGAGPSGPITVHIASVNHKSCQVHLRSDVRDLAMEDRVRTRTKSQARRGSVTVQITASSTTLGPDRSRLAELWKNLEQLAHELGAPPPSLEGVASMLRGGEDGLPDGFDEALSPILDEALAALDQARLREGATIQADLGKRHEALIALRAAMAERAPERLPLVRAALMTRLQEVISEGIPEELIAREVAQQADRLDIGEELSRLEAHLAALADLLAESADEPQGRRLEFLLQEVGREVNTVGSKANDAELTRLVLSAKNELEAMREQAANVL